MDFIDAFAATVAVLFIGLFVAECLGYGIDWFLNVEEEKL